MNILSSLNPARRSIGVASAVSLLALAATLSPSAHAQQTAYATLPDSPGFSREAPAAAFSSSSAAEPSGGQSADIPGDGDGKQTKRILGIVPNFHSVSANEHLPPQPVKEKFVETMQDSFDYSSVLLPAVIAAYSDANKSTPEFHHGAAAYGRYFWHSFVDQTDENIWVEFIVPTVTHEDTRYYTLGHGGKKKRALYAIKHVIITRSDAGNPTFNFGEVFGAGIASGISTLYYPRSERDFSHVGSQWGQNIGIDAATFIFREFWPDINSHLFHLKDE